MLSYEYTELVVWSVMYPVLFESTEIDVIETAG